MFEWFDCIPELLQGAILTLLGFLFAVVWDVIKARREQKAKDESIVATLKISLEENLSRIEKNRRILGHEAEGKYNDVPLVPLDSSKVWSILAINLPKTVLADRELFNFLKMITVQSDFVNQYIRDRDQFRVTQKALSSYESTVINFGKLIVNCVNEIEPIYKSSLEKLGSGKQQIRMGLSN